MKNKYKAFFAGELFDHKHITGNLLLAQKIEKLSDSLYECILPQDWKGVKFDNAIDIRNKNFKLIMQSDVIVFNFDGVDLDSGTVAEFMFAKMLDIPAILLRTEHRNKGYLFGDDWNLMVNGFPRTTIVKHAALELYNYFGLEKTHEKIAKSVINAVKKVMNQEPVLKSYDETISAYQHVIKSCGSGLNKIISDELLNELISSKLKKSLSFTKKPVCLRQMA